jgi:hypothetical protein
MMVKKRGKGGWKKKERKKKRGKTGWQLVSPTTQKIGLAFICQFFYARRQPDWPWFHVDKHSTIMLLALPENKIFD